MADKETTPAGERIAKRIARAGLCSRRDAERWIADGRVAVDGEVLTSPAFTVTAASRITVDGQPLPDAEAPRLFRLHKPTGVLTAARDPDGRKTIADLIPAELPRLMPVGRLDLNSEGLLLLTNDGGLKRRLELPATGWQRRYRVRVHGAVDEAKLDALKRGITIEGFDYGPIEAVLERTVGSNAWLQVALREGKNREIRKVMEHFGWPVSRLIRVSFGPFQLGNLDKGGIEEIKGKVLKEQLGVLLEGGSETPKRRTRRPAVKSAPRPAAKAEAAWLEAPKPAPRLAARLRLPKSTAAIVGNQEAGSEPAAAPATGRQVTRRPGTRGGKRLPARGQAGPRSSGTRSGGPRSDGPRSGGPGSGKGRPGGGRRG
jgi:23S rRNA pseudouridine2605 synthase